MNRKTYLRTAMRWSILCEVLLLLCVVLGLFIKESHPDWSVLAFSAAGLVGVLTFLIRGVFAETYFGEENDHLFRMFLWDIAKTGCYYISAVVLLGIGWYFFNLDTLTGLFVPLLLLGSGTLMLLIGYFEQASRLNAYLHDLGFRDLINGNPPKAVKRKKEAQVLAQKPIDSAKLFWHLKQNQVDMTTETNLVDVNLDLRRN
jgi:hypothetical protein